MTLFAGICDVPLSGLSPAIVLEWLSKNHPELSVAWGWVCTDGGKKFFDAIEVASLTPSYKEKGNEKANLSVRKLLNKTLTNLLPGRWTASKTLEPSVSSFTFTSYITEQRLSTITLWGNTGQIDPKLTLNDDELFQLENLSSVLGLLHHQRHAKEQLEDLQRHMRYMMVWSESIEWISGLRGETKEFNKQLLKRAMLLTDANSGAFRLLESGNGNAESPWITNRMTADQVRGVESFLKQQDNAIETLTQTINFDASTDRLSLPLTGTHLLICPVANARKTGKACIVLAKTARGTPFTLADQIYLNLLLEQVHSGMEKNLLLLELNSTNQSLLSEKKEQQILIQKLHGTQDQLRQSEKMASIGQLAAGVAHEINNPISFISSNLNSLAEYCHSLSAAITEIAARAARTNDPELIREIKAIADRNEFDYIEADLPELIDASRDGLQRVTAIVQDLKDFSRADNGQFKLVDINQAIERTLNIANNELKCKAEVCKKLAEIPPAELVESQLGQVLLNILVNAAQAIDHKGVITIRTSLAEEPGYVLISITDTGVGIAKECLPHLFDPFYTTKAIGKGTGLGLSICYGIVKRHQGEILVSSELGSGTTFTLKLPIKRSEALKEND